MIAGASIVGPAVSLAGSIFGGPSPNDERFVKIEGWYKTAVAALPSRDTFEECKLKYYSGRFGPHDCGAGIITGWATQDAKDYTYRAYNQFLAVAAGQISKSTPLASPADSVPGVANTLATISGVTGVAASALGAQTVQQQQLAQAASIGKTVLVVGLIAVVAYLALKGRR